MKVIMKHVSKLFFLALAPFLMTGCQEKSSSSSSSSNSYSQSCTLNWYAYGCPGYTGGSTSGTGTADCSSGTNYWTSSSCYGYSLCMQNPKANTACPNYSSTTGGTTGGTNTYPYYPSSSVNQTWNVQYPPSNNPPAGTCSTAYAPSGISFTPYETRVATMSIAGQTFYSPNSYLAPNYLNTSSILKSVASARTLFETDSLLKVRFKVRPQPVNTASNPYCYIENYKNVFSIAGYTKLQFTVNLVGKKGSTEYTEPVGSYTVGVNSCTPAIDLSSYASRYPDGIYLTVSSVLSNQAYYPNDYDYNGFTNSSNFGNVRSMDCWILDVEVAADGTKTFD